MKCFLNIANNYWQTLRKKDSQPCSRMVIWWVVKLALLVLSLICKLIDFFNGVGTDN